MHPNMQSSRDTGHGHPGLACDGSRTQPLMIAHGSEMNSIRDKVGAAPGRLIWSHLVTEGVCVTQFTVGKTRGLGQPRTRNDPVALDS